MTLLPALALFALVQTATPGPNNMMLMASGANFGLRRTVPHILGIVSGLAVMILAVGIGLMQLFDRFPVVHAAISVVSVAYLLWLAWRIAQAAPPADRTGAGGRPMTSLQAALFQWVNPKAWSMIVAAIALYAPGRSLPALAMLAAVFVAVGLPSNTTWTLLGRQLRRLLTSRARLRAFNWGMAAILLLSLLPVLRHAG